MAYEEMERLEERAQQSDPDAQNELGVCHEDGDGVSQDAAEVVKCFQKAADRGDATDKKYIDFYYT